MKELSIEEKAKAYEEALALMQDCIPDENGLVHIRPENIFPKLAESKDEKIRKWLICTLKSLNNSPVQIDGAYEMMLPAIDWLEKQGTQILANSAKTCKDEQKTVPDWMPKFLDELRSKKNYFDWDEYKDIEGCILAIINWMNPNYFNEKDGEQKPTDKVEPKFKVGNWYLCVKDFYGKGVRFDKGHAYYCGLNGCLQEFDSGAHIAIVEKLYDYFRLWTIQDAKDGDVLVNQNGEMPFIFKECENNHIYCYCGYTNIKDIFFARFVDSEGEELHWLNLYHEQAYPATKKQRDLLFKKIHETGYEWDAEKKELKKIEQNPAWSGEDEIGFCDAMWAIEQARTTAKDENDMGNAWYAEHWLKSLKDRYTWKPSDEQMIAIQEAINIVGILTITGSRINSLYQDLNKLKRIKL